MKKIYKRPTAKVIQLTTETLIAQSFGMHDKAGGSEEAPTETPNNSSIWDGDQW